MTVITKTSLGLNVMRSAISGAQNPKITHVALGTSSTAPTAGDIALGNEVFRKAVTSWTNGATGEIFINLYLAPGELTGVTIQEVGFFANGSSTPGSGWLMAHGLYAHTKVGTESIQFQLDETFS